MSTQGKVEVMYRKQFFCPLKGRGVKVDFLAYRGEPTSLLGVEHCSAFQEKEAIDCDRSCLHLPQAQMAPPLYRPFPILE